MRRKQKTSLANNESRRAGGHKYRKTQNEWPTRWNENRQNSTQVWRLARAGFEPNSKHENGYVMYKVLTPHAPLARRHTSHLKLRLQSQPHSPTVHSCKTRSARVAATARRTPRHSHSTSTGGTGRPAPRPRESRGRRRVAATARARARAHRRHRRPTRRRRRRAKGRRRRQESARRPWRAAVAACAWRGNRQRSATVEAAGSEHPRRWRGAQWP